MLSNNQINSIKNIYVLFTNITNDAYMWINNLEKNKEIQTHIENLIMIMNIIKNENIVYEGEIDDLIIIVEENLKEYILEMYASELEDTAASESDENEFI
jgi:hypothetical protein